VPCLDIDVPLAWYSQVTTSPVHLGGTIQQVTVTAGGVVRRTLPNIELKFEARCSLCTLHVCEQPSKDKQLSPRVALGGAWL
jgi:hypothetical protein